jgi:acyl carrier protein
VSFLSKANVAEHVLALCRSLNENSETAITLDTSLTHSLIFDSMKLVQFFAGVEALYPGVALEDWFIEHSPDGRDTLRSAVSYLMRFLDPQAAKG